LELEKVLEIYSRLPTPSGLVELRYHGADRNLITKPGYFTQIFDTPIDEIPEQWRGQYGEGREHPEPPFVVLHGSLDRNQCPREPLEVRCVDIEDIWPTATVSLKS
jgi:hypothetical protein